jgi:hypothetical protein
MVEMVAALVVEQVVAVVAALDKLLVKNNYLLVLKFFIY